MEKWVHSNTIVGPAATGTRYFQREYINDEFWREVQKGSHILFVAPRRVGKTSIMKDLAENPPEGYYCIYQNIQAVKTKNEFYKRLFDLFLQCVNKAEKAKTVLAAWLKKYSIEEIKTSGVKIKSKDIDYEEEIKNLIPQLKELKIHTVIFLDEFAEVINTLNNRQQHEDAIDILNTLREIRGDADFKHFTIVFAGSIGLEFVIKSIDRLTLINDLHKIKTGPLTKEEATHFIKQITHGASVQYSDEHETYLKDKISHLLPYYIQLMIEEIDLIAYGKKDTTINQKIIDEAFNNVLSKGGNFEDWLTRLKKYQQSNFAFINEILKGCAHKGSMQTQKIYNLAEDPKYNKTDDYMDFVEQLKHDGYLTEDPENEFRFISPFLQQYWKNKYRIYND